MSLHIIADFQTNPCIHLFLIFIVAVIVIISTVEPAPIHDSKPEVGTPDVSQSK